VALLVCPDCGGPVSDAATACPRCGRPSRPVPVAAPLRAPPSGSRVGRGCAWTVGALVVIAVIGVLTDKRPSTDAVAPFTRYSIDGTATDSLRAAISDSLQMGFDTVVAIVQRTGGKSNGPVQVAQWSGDTMRLRVQAPDTCDASSLKLARTVIQVISKQRHLAPPFSRVACTDGGGTRAVVVK
jgi:hypothetical protein